MKQYVLFLIKNHLAKFIDGKKQSYNVNQYDQYQYQNSRYIYFNNNDQINYK